MSICAIEVATGTGTRAPLRSGGGGSRGGEGITLLARPAFTPRPAGLTISARSNLSGLSSYGSAAQRPNIRQALALDWLSGVYESVAIGNTERGMYIVFKEMDRLARTSQFLECSRVLNSVDVDRLEINTGMAFLMSTSGIAHKIGSRPVYAARLRQFLLRSEPVERIDNLLRGLLSE